VADVIVVDDLRKSCRAKRARRRRATSARRTDDLERRGLPGRWGLAFAALVVLVASRFFTWETD
jgi:hypothetical protein